MNFWKLVAAIVVGNLLTGVVVTVVWMVFMASLFAAVLSPTSSTQLDPPADTGGEYEPLSGPTASEDMTKWPSAKGRKLSPPDANGCIKELAEEVGARC